MAIVECSHSPTIRRVSPLSRFGHAATVKENEIFFFGGSSFDEDDEHITYHGDFFKLAVHGCKMYWMRMLLDGHAPPKRAEHSICLHNNQLYVYGGKNDPSAEYCLPGLYVYDIGYQKWEYLYTSGMAPSTLGHTMSCIDDMLYVLGGYVKGEISNQLYMLHVKQLIWTKLTTCGSISARYNHRAAVISDAIYIFGGCAGKDIWLNDLHILDTSTLTWYQPRVHGPQPPPRAYHTMLADRNKVIIKIIHFRFAVLYTSEQGIIANIANEVLILADTTAEYLYIYGGASNSAPHKRITFNDLHQYNTVTHEWTALFTMPTPINCFSLAAGIIQNKIDNVLDVLQVSDW
ncbi:hypothetical protein LSH36_285g02057 [Paralvinella palmiformis]|uniref:Uncharacterized protein n=1 Tax=Paralvinella palmiformis TaxID=53620 RepID=A0AAD9N4B6_9ANNE|nr:hypothetical protein LSH36_285g02057 [Paralvinella palmiformis]